MAFTTKRNWSQFCLYNIIYQYCVKIHTVLVLNQPFQFTSPTLNSISGLVCLPMCIVVCFLCVMHVCYWWVCFILCLGLALWNLALFYATHTRLTALFPRLPRWAGTRKVKPIWILLKQEAVSGSGISWAICKSAPRSRQITTPAPHHSVFYRPDALPAAQPTASKHWRQLFYATILINLLTY